MMNKPSHINHNREEHEPDGKAGDKSAESASQTTIHGTDATYSSQLSLENPQGFSRDAFGRQSMSEKRHATLDAKSTDTYQRTKKMREDRIKKEFVRSGNVWLIFVSHFHVIANIVRVGSVESVISVNRSSEHPEYADKLAELGPSLGMKKSSSLESLQTMVQEIQMQEEGDPAYSYRGPSGALKVIRGRGSEETFRAAVVDPNHRNEMGAKKHWLLDGPVEEREIDGFTNVRGGPRQSSLNAALDTKNKPCKKKPGIFKGIGSMFSHMLLLILSNTSNENSRSKGNPFISDMGSFIDTLSRFRRATLYYALKLVLAPYRYIFFWLQVIPENAVAPPVKYRQNVNANRENARQRLAHRHTYYQSDERENIYDRQLLQQSREPQYGEFGRPGSRSGITEAPPVPFTHYVNYNELQTHISRKESLSDSQIVQMRLQVQQQRLKVEEESRKQHQYHSQRQPRPESQLRPISNYYEYESVQSVLNNRQARPTNAHYPQQDINANSVQSRQNLAVHSRPGQPRGGNAIARQAGQHRGPFVTQVTIGEHQKNGTKV
ncbi:hypothetical protein D910_08964 [Dendroctonus ponderosae]|uniref:Uncharacterized protein n=1 Tax=Dendroctonus ponderosae TaxID=77166 RepID=U4UCG3_DENPD|nr:hypothetical protein D910_08964 [Dendroctonus ponderosae]